MNNQINILMKGKIKNRHRLKKKEIRELLDELEKNWTCELFNEKNSVEVGDYQEEKIIFIDNQAHFLFHNHRVFFTIHGLNAYKPNERRVVIDMGAVGFVSKGADVMAPGIIDSDENILEGDQVWICDERHLKPIAIGIALSNGVEMKSSNKGKSIKVIHYVGDMIWNLGVDG
jgi:PUA domain protein